MKKITLLVLMVFSLGLFANVTMITEGSIGTGLRQTDTNTWSLGKTTSAFKVGDANDMLTIVARWDALALGAAGFLDYVWIDSKVGEGVLRVGKQRLGIMNSQPGVTESGKYLGLICLKDTGVAYTTSAFTGFPVKVLHVQNINLLDETGAGADGVGQIGVLAQPMAGVQVGGIFAQNNTTEKSGLAVFADYMITIEGFNILAQGYMELSDDAATVRGLFTKPAQLVHLAVDTMFMDTKFYGYFVTDLNEDNHGTFKSEAAAGLKKALSAKTSLVIELTQTETSSKTTAAQIGLDFKI